MAGNFLQLPIGPQSSTSTQKLKKAATMQSYMKAKGKNSYWKSGDSKDSDAEHEHVD